MILLELYIGNFIKVCGDPTDIAYYTFAVLSMLKFKSDHEAAEVAKKEAELFEKFGTMTFEELMKHETEVQKTNGEEDVEGK